MVYAAAELNQASTGARQATVWSRLRSRPRRRFR
jgi:hypothetical protein